MGLRAHERRLRATFQRLLLLALAPPAALQACGDDVVPGGLTGVDAGDATTANDAPASDRGTPDVEEASMADAGSESRSYADANASEDADAAQAADGTDGAEESNGPADAAADAVTDARSPWCADASVGVPWWPADSGTMCQYFVDLSCAPYVPAGCLLSGTDCLKVCTLNTPLFDCQYAPPACATSGQFVAEAGQPVTVQCDLCPGAGRRPAGLRSRRKRARTGTAAGDYFARAAYLEAASVHAFERLELELRAHGAPESLARAARRSARDEVRHAARMRRMAERHGSEPATPRVGFPSIRSLEEVARENAVEGCVRETYGALVAAWQAAHAADARTRRCFAGIAAEEIRHAALAWAVADWAEKRLDVGARKRIARSRHTATRRLWKEIGSDPPRDLAALAGLPSARQARMLLAGLAQSITASCS